LFSENENDCHGPGGGNNDEDDEERKEKVNTCMGADGTLMRKGKKIKSGGIVGSKKILLKLNSGLDLYGRMYFIAIFSVYSSPPLSLSPLSPLLSASYSRHTCYSPLMAAIALSEIERRSLLVLCARSLSRGSAALATGPILARAEALLYWTPPSSLLRPRMR
jgi:hypothetical protein